MAFGGFKTVELNAVGWGAVFVSGSSVGAAGALLSDAPPPAGIAIGVVLAFAVARALDEVSDRRRTSYVPVANADEAMTKLLSIGVSVRGQTAAAVNGRRVQYLAVRERDAELAASAVGLPRESRRAQRRWRYAERAAALPATKR